MATRRGGFTMESLRLPLAALGIFGILAGLGAMLVEGQFGLIERILIAAGILFLGIYVALDPEDVWAKLTGRGAMYSGNTLVLAVAALVILAFLNVLGSRFQTKLDLTSNKQFTLSDQSIRVAENLPAPIKVTAFLTTSDGRKQDFQTLLNDYATRSGGKLSYEFIDPEQRPGDAIAAGITQTGTVVYQMGDKKQDSTGTTERDISTALVKLARPEKKVYFTQGHGERSLDSFDQAEFSQIKQALERDNFTTAPLNLITTRAIPDDAAELVIAGPTNPFLPEEKDVLKAYLDGGGKLFLMVGPGSQADFNDLLSPYGVSIDPTQLVVDPAQPFLNDVRVPVVDRYGTHAITRDLRLATFYPAVSGISISAANSGTATVVPLAQSSDQSWGNTNQQQVVKQDNDPKGPLPLAVAIEANPQGGGAPASSEGPSGARIVVVGTANFVANRFLGVASGNQDLFLDSANWLANEDNLISVRAPETVSRTMLLTGPQINLVKFSSWLFLPLAVLAAGAAVWWTRR
jgi:ABC-type uncharacterized transport system involved in gliding motility auxiliary subunit